MTFSIESWVLQNVEVIKKFTHTVAFRYMSEHLKTVSEHVKNSADGNVVDFKVFFF